MAASLRCTLVWQIKNQKVKNLLIFAKANCVVYFGVIKYSLTIAFLIFFKTLSSQNYFEALPTQFDTFINRPSVHWATYLFDTIRFTKQNLSSILVKRMERGEIQTACYIASGTKYANCIEYCPQEYLDSKFYPICVLPLYDSTGNTIGNYDPSKPSSGVDSLSQDLLFTTQVLYVENGTLKSYIPWVSPAYTVKTQSGFFIGFGEYFASCINSNVDFAISSQEKIIHLGRRNKRLLVDSLPKQNMLKELYGKNLVWSLWPFIENGKINLYPANSSNKLLPENFNKFIVSPNPHCWDTYDENGLIVGGLRCQNESLIQFYITEVDIIQDWYYDYSKNIVTCKIPEVYLYAGKDDDGNICKPSQPVLKIVF